jgi:hypothetical protein
MQAIPTRYYGPTNFKGSCIRAKCEATSIRMSYDHSVNIEENHKKACTLLMQKMGWHRSMVGGVFNGDWYWVFFSKVAPISPVAENPEKDGE